MADAAGQIVALYAWSDTDRHLARQAGAQVQLERIEVFTVRPLHTQSFCDERRDQPFAYSPKELTIARSLAERCQVTRLQRPIRDVVLAENAPLAEAEPDIRSNRCPISRACSSAQEI